MSFEKIIGYENVKEELSRLLDVLKNKEKYAKLGAKQPQGLLIYGEQGIGKTLFATNFINDSNRKCFVCRKDKADGDFVNHIKSIFDKASNETPSIVLLDDIDKFSNEDEQYVNTEEYITVQSCIDQVKDKDVYVVATANNIDVLPKSLKRDGRFDNRIQMSIPTGENANKIIRHFLSNLSLMDEETIADVTKILEGKSTAEIESIINEAGIRAGYNNKTKIETDDIIKAYLRKEYETPDFSDNMDEYYLKRVAYHEAGHVVVEEELNFGTVNLVSILDNKFSDKCGITNFETDEYYFYDKTFMENRVMTLLGGKAATELVYGATDVGCNNDLHRAFDIVTRFVDNYCSFDFSSFGHAGSSNELRERIDDRVAQEMQKYYLEAKNILTNNREYLDGIAELLLEKKILTQKDIREVANRCKKSLPKDYYVKKEQVNNEN